MTMTLAQVVCKKAICLGGYGIFLRAVRIESMFERSNIMSEIFLSETKAGSGYQKRAPVLKFP